MSPHFLWPKTSLKTAFINAPRLIEISVIESILEEMFQGDGQADGEKNRKEAQNPEIKE